MRLLLLTIIFLALNVTPGHAQIIPNGNFENWDTLEYEDINSSYWATANRIWALDGGISMVSKVAGYSSQHAVRLEVKTLGPDTLFPFIGNEMEGILDAEGGKPYVGGLPTAFRGYYRHTLLNNDTAMLIMILKKNSTILSSDTVKFAGSQSTFTQFSIPYSLANTPDTIITLAVIGDIINEIPGTPGSWLELDSLHFVSGGMPILLPGGNFEKWINHSYDVPDDWDILSDPYPGTVIRTKDAVSGLYALQLSTLVDSFFMDTAVAEVESDFIPLPTGATTDSLIFHYKFTSPGSSVAAMKIHIYNSANLPIGPSSGILGLGADSNYSRVSLPLIGMRLQPGAASFKITFSSTKIPGSVLFVDNMYAISYDGVTDVPKITYLLFPNPAQNILKIAAKETLDYSIKDLAGRNMLCGHTSSGSINIAELPSGSYLLMLSNKDGIQQTTRFNKQ